MATQASWGPKSFVISNSKITGIKDLKTAYALKTGNNEDTSGTPPTNTKGRELQEVSFSVQYLKAAGANPRSELSSWYGQIGNAYPMYLGGKTFGPPKLQLQHVDVSDVILSNSGDMLACTLSISLKEYSDTSTTNAVAGGKAKSSSGGYTTEELKQIALNAKPSTAEKNSKKG